MGPFPSLHLAPFARSFDGLPLPPASRVSLSSPATGYSLTRYRGDTTAAICTPTPNAGSRESDPETPGPDRFGSPGDSFRNATSSTFNSR